MKQFSTSASRGNVAVPNSEPITFEFEVGSGDFVEMTAAAPTTGQLALYFASMTGGPMAMITGAFDFLGQLLSDDDWNVIYKELQEGADVAVVIQIINWLVEQWTNRPTLPSNGSSASPKPAGTRSTVQRRGRA